MKSFIFLAILSLKMGAVEINLVGPCSKTPVNKGEIKLNDLNTSVGELTINYLETNKIPYIGAPEGLNSLLGTPTGLDAIEVLSDTKMRAYGWCFMVNEKIPDAMPDKVKFKSNQDQLTWFYAYSTYDNGNWTDYCVPSYLVAAKQFCH